MTAHKKFVTVYSTASIYLFMFWSKGLCGGIIRFIVATGSILDHVAQKTFYFNNSSRYFYDWQLVAYRCFVPGWADDAPYSIFTGNLLCCQSESSRVISFLGLNKEDDCVKRQIQCYRQGQLV